MGARLRAATGATIVDHPRKYWFPAKTYGWGWGPPATWQGWVVLAIYIAVVGAVSIYSPPAKDIRQFFAGIGLATMALLLVCLVKGEPPRWRWGKK